MAKKLKHHNAPYSPEEVAQIRDDAHMLFSARVTAARVGRTLGGLKYYCLKHGIHFRSINQKRGVQKKLAKMRAKYGMNATLKG